MAKVTRSYTLDEDVVEGLQKEVNSSKLVNDLLREHLFGTATSKKEEINARLKQLIAQKEEIDEKMKTLVHKYDELCRQEEQQKEMFKDFPEWLLEDFNRFPNMTEEVLSARFKGMYKGRVQWETLKDMYAKFVDSRTIN